MRNNICIKILLVSKDKSLAQRVQNTLQNAFQDINIIIDIVKSTKDDSCNLDDFDFCVFIDLDNNIQLVEELKNIHINGDGVKVFINRSCWKANIDDTDSLIVSLHIDGFIDDNDISKLIICINKIIRTQQKINMLTNKLDRLQLAIDQAC